MKEMDIEEYLIEQHFSSGRVCPTCGGTHMHQNGRCKNGNQKFICKYCGRTFSIRKNTIISDTRKSLAVWHGYMDCMTEVQGLYNDYSPAVWHGYMDCMTEGLTLDESGGRCGILHRKSFNWRHKIPASMPKSKDGHRLGGAQQHTTRADKGWQIHEVHLHIQHRKHTIPNSSRMRHLSRAFSQNTSIITLYGNIRMEPFERRQQISSKLWHQHCLRRLDGSSFCVRQYHHW